MNRRTVSLAAALAVGLVGVTALLLFLLSQRRPASNVAVRPTSTATASASPAPTVAPSPLASASASATPLPAPAVTPGCSAPAAGTTARALPSAVPGRPSPNALAFIRQGDVYLLPFGGDPVALTKDANASFVSWAPDARRLAYTVQRGGCEGQLRLVDLDSRIDRAVLVGTVASGQVPAFGPDGRQMYAITSEPAPNNMLIDAVMRVELATGQTARLDQFPPYGGHGGGFPPVLRAAQWSRLGYGAAWSAGPLPPQLRLFRADTRPLGQRASNTPPAWRPGASQVVVSTGDRGLLMVDVGTGAERVLDRDGGSLPVWSPDGGRVVYVRVSAGSNPQLYVVSVATGAIARAVEEPAAFPTWSADGQWIAYVRQVPVAGPSAFDGRGLSLVKADGSGGPLLLTADDSSQAPVFMPAASR